MVVEIVDEKGKIEEFQHQLKGLFDRTKCGGLVTLETVEVIHYLPQKGAH